jgi:hypothetical protein
MSLSPEDNRSWLLNEAAVAAAARDWPKAVERIRKNLKGLADRNAASPDLLSDYQALLDQGPETFRRELLATTERAQALRSLHPLSGLIDPKARFAIIRRTKRP